MLKVTNLVTPSPEQFEVVIKGMRLPFKSGDKSDSYIIPFGDDDWDIKGPSFILGKKDKQLLLNLCKAGDPSHRKLLRQLPVVCDITAPLYWWKQADKYQIGTVTNAESTMHTITKYPFKIEDFSLGDLADADYYIESGHVGVELNQYVESIIPTLNMLRDRYLETDDKKYWYAINRLLPQSYNQTRTWSGNYEVLVNMINQRKGHKLEEWETFREYMLKNVPYLKEVVEAINESN